MKNITAPMTIEKCKEIIARYGIPVMLVSDNGTTFTSDLFQKFIKEMGIIHARTAPYHPATNGLAERFVQTLKQSLRKKDKQETITQHLQEFLSRYRITPLADLKVSPAGIMFGRKIRSKLDLLFPIDRKQIVYENDKTVRQLKIGDRVLVRDYLNKKCKWREGTIKQRLGKLHYIIDVNKNKLWKHHIDQTRKVMGNNQLKNNLSNTWDYELPRIERERSALIAQDANVPINENDNNLAEAEVALREEIQIGN